MANVGTKNGPLDPNGPFKIMALDAVSADKKQDYEQKRNTLFAAIKERVDQ